MTVVIVTVVIVTVVLVTVVIVTLVMVVSDSSDGSNSDTKLKNSNCDKTQKLKLRSNTKILNVTKFKNSNCDKLNKKIVTTQSSNCEEKKCHISHFTFHMSYVMCQVSGVKCTFFLLIFLFSSPFFGQSGGASRWRLCYPRGLSRLV